MPLNTQPNFVVPDDFYEALIDTHQDLDDQESQALNCRLILLLANHIGDLQILREALVAARGAASQKPTDTTTESN